MQESATKLANKIAKPLQALTQRLARGRIRQSHMRVSGRLTEITARSQRDMRFLQRTLTERPRIQTSAGNVEVRVERTVRFNFQRQSNFSQTVYHDAAAFQ